MTDPLHPEPQMRDVIAALEARDAPYRAELDRIGAAIGYGRAQQLLGELWDAMLDAADPSPDGTSWSCRGQMGVTIDDALPPIPKATKLRREMGRDGGYSMVPAYTVDEMTAFGRACIERAQTANTQPPATGKEIWG